MIRLVRCGLGVVSLVMGWSISKAELAASAIFSLTVIRLANEEDCDANE